MLNRPFRLAVLAQPRWLTGNFVEPYFVRLPTVGSGVVNVPGMLNDIRISRKFLRTLKASDDPRMQRAAREYQAQHLGGLQSSRGLSNRRAFEETAPVREDGREGARGPADVGARAQGRPGADRPGQGRLRRQPGADREVGAARRRRPPGPQGHARVLRLVGARGEVRGGRGGGGGEGVRQHADAAALPARAAGAARQVRGLQPAGAARGAGADAVPAVGAERGTVRLLDDAGAPDRPDRAARQDAAGGAGGVGGRARRPPAVAAEVDAGVRPAHEGRRLYGRGSATRRGG